MFETVGRDKKQDKGRNAGSFLLSLMLNGGFLGGLIWAGASVAEDVIDDFPVEVTFFDAAPPPPPPPPPAGGGEKPEEEEEDEPDDEPEDVEPDPVEIPEEQPEIEEKPKETGVDGGVEGGVEGGVVGGVIGGVIGGVLGGQLGGTGVRAYHWSEVKPKRRVTPKYPKSAQQLGLEGSCQVRFFIDEKGAPYDIKIEKCPKVFHDEALKAAWQWRFYPMKEQGRKIKASFLLALRFKLKS